MRQLLNNDFTLKKFLYINRFYDDVKQCGKDSFVSQLNDLKEFTSYSLLDQKNALNLIDNRFQCNDFILRESVRNVLYEFNIKHGYLYINKLLNLFFFYRIEIVLNSVYSINY